MSAPIGGQAVLEGVMMRGPSNWAVAVRKPNGQIAEVCRPIESVMKRHWFFRLPVVRGGRRQRGGRDRALARRDRLRLPARDRLRDLALQGRTRAARRPAADLER